MPPLWLTVLSWLSLGLACLAAVDILVDLYGPGHRQQMPVTEAVWPVTALYLGPVASWAYRRYGRPASPQWRSCTWCQSLRRRLLFAWMALMHFVLFPDPHLRPDTAAWFLMQVGMILGFATAWPANVWLIRHGIKEAM